MSKARSRSIILGGPKKAGEYVFLPGKGEKRAITKAYKGGAFSIHEHFEINGSKYAKI